MKILHIAAMDQNRAIGKDGKIPWSCEEDLRRFKQITMGNAVLMGRKTWESLPAPLKGRLNIIVSRNEEFRNKIVKMKKDAGGSLDFIVAAASIKEGAEIAEESGYHELYIIGGGEIYRKTVPYCHELRFTVIDTEIKNADTHYPHLASDYFATIYTEEHDGYLFTDAIPAFQPQDIKTIEED